MNIWFWTAFAAAAAGVYGNQNQQPFRGEDGQEGIILSQHSLRKPYMDSTMQIPNWAFMGDTVITKNMIRLTPDKPSKQGSLWNYVPNNFYNWQTVFEFKVSGDAPRLYGDGFAFWYTKDWGVRGQVFGNQDLFSGLAVFFDTYSNHQGEHNHGHPYVSAMLNDGTRQYDHDADGTHTELAGCQASFRGKDTPTKARVTYVNRTLTVELDYRGYSTWMLCFQEPGVDLPTGYHFGFSAATGALSDNHDIISLNMLGFRQMTNKGQPVKDYRNLKPGSDRVINQRAHVESPKPSPVGQAARKGFQVSIYLALVGAVCLVVIFVVRTKLRARDMKRF